MENPDGYSRRILLNTGIIDDAMKTYKEITFEITPFSEDICDALISEMGTIGYDGFALTENGFKAYIDATIFNENKLSRLELLKILPEDYQVAWKYDELADRDWNKEWEDHFTPILVKGCILVRAGFHPSVPGITYEIIIEPKMSFGTGHHATTALMLGMLLHYKDQIQGKKVLDMGCGTGILSIMASKAGAGSVTGIDIDEWAFENAMENIWNNQLCNIQIKIGDASLLEQEKEFGFILANINRNILLRDMSFYIRHLSQGGTLIMSGFYTQDLPLIRQEAERLGLTYQKQEVENNWVAASFYK